LHCILYQQKQFVVLKKDLGEACHSPGPGDVAAIFGSPSGGRRNLAEK
jgi:hypothetical protein